MISQDLKRTEVPRTFVVATAETLDPSVPSACLIWRGRHWRSEVHTVSVIRDICEKQTKKRNLKTSLYDTLSLQFYSISYSHGVPYERCCVQSKHEAAISSTWVWMGVMLWQREREVTHCSFGQFLGHFCSKMEDFLKSRRSLRNLGVVQQIDVLGICHRRYIGPDRRRRQRLG